MEEVYIKLLNKILKTGEPPSKLVLSFLEYDTLVIFYKHLKQKVGVLGVNHELRVLKNEIESRRRRAIFIEQEDYYEQRDGTSKDWTGKSCLLMYFIKKLRKQEKRLLLVGVTLKNTDLSNQDWSRVALIHCEFSNISFKNANLHKISCDECNFENVDFENANLANADLSACNLVGANLVNADLNGADLTGSNLSRADLSGADLASANLTYTNLTFSTLYKSFVEFADFKKADLSYSDVTDVHFINVRSLNLAKKEGMFKDNLKKRPDVSAPWYLDYPENY